MDKPIMLPVNLIEPIKRAIYEAANKGINQISLDLDGISPYAKGIITEIEFDNKSSGPAVIIFQFHTDYGTQYGRIRIDIDFDLGF